VTQSLTTDLSRISGAFIIARNTLDKARSHFDCALELDPDNVDALVRRALVDLAFVGLYFATTARSGSAPPRLT
jgi:hypothetical protein